MQYQSIIRLLEYCNIDCDTMDVGKIRKILTAEFALAESGVISVDGFDYTKNDIFQELEREDFAERLDYHQLVWKNQSLLECLEKNTVNFQQVSSWFQLRWHKSFPAFISPYFAESFDKIMRKFLNPIDFGEATRWFRMSFFINNAEDEDKALSGVRIFISEFTKILKNVNSVTYIDILPELEDWTAQSCYAFINSFPGSLYKLKDELVRALINLTARTQSANRNLAYEVSCQLIQITGIDPEVEDLIQKNHKIFEDLPPSGTKTDYRSCFWIAIVAISFIVRIATYQSSSNSSSSYKESSRFKYTEKEQVTSEYFENLRNKYAMIDKSLFVGKTNKSLLIYSNWPYFLLFEQSKKDSVTVGVFNNGAIPITLYLLDAGKTIFTVNVNVGEKIKIRRDRNTLDMLLSTKKVESQFSFSATPIYIFDSSDFTTHNVLLEEKEGGGMLYWDKWTSFSEGDFIMEIYAEANTSKKNSFPINTLRFKNANWSPYSAPQPEN
jgi:hypothetical protein